MDDETDEIISFAGFVLLQNLTKKKTDSYRSQVAYRPPVAYEKLVTWSLLTVGWGDNFFTYICTMVTGNILKQYSHELPKLCL